MGNIFDGIRQWSPEVIFLMRDETPVAQGLWSTLMTLSMAKSESVAGSVSDERRDWGPWLMVLRLSCFTVPFPWVSARLNDIQSYHVRFYRSRKIR